ncbi:hypothetical protein MASR1M90_12730 [Desulfovibrionales bacterium]
MSFFHLGTTTARTTRHTAKAPARKNMTLAWLRRQDMAQASTAAWRWTWDGTWKMMSLNGFNFFIA